MLITPGTGLTSYAPSYVPKDSPNLNDRTLLLATREATISFTKSKAIGWCVRVHLSFSSELIFSIKSNPNQNFAKTPVNKPPACPSNVGAKFKLILQQL